MKYFPYQTEGIFSSKVNFVDENNRLVGYDFYQSCCEDYGWYISLESDFAQKNTIVVGYPYDVDSINEKLDGWVFDPVFIKEYSIGDHGYNESNAATFRLVKDDKEMFLHLYNEHNGYYSHGFEFLEEGNIIHRGFL
jgi:hypothetical protein